MNSCAKKILMIFGGLLIFVAVFLVPVRRVWVTEQQGLYYGTRTTQAKSEFTSLAVYVKHRGTHTSERTGSKVTTSLRTALYGTLIGMVLVVGAADYLLFCVWLRRKKPGPEQEGVQEEPDE